ncbi:MAG: HNH endonuclease [Gemmatimonadaceae bacterium]
MILARTAIVPADAEFVDGLSLALRGRGASISELPDGIATNPFPLTFEHEARLYKALVHVRRLTPQRGVGTDHHRGADEWHAQMIFDNSRRGRGVRNRLARRPAYRTVLLGYAEIGTAFVIAAWDAKRRAEYAYSRSLQVRERTLHQAAEFGVGQQQSRGDETVVAFRPEFFPEYLASTADLHAAVDTGGEPETEADIPEDFFGPRDRRIVSSNRPVRDVRFKNFVARHYAMCVVCKLDSDALLHAAHIVPVADPRSSDHPSNGLLLCRNCHALFDAGLLLVRPDYTVEIPRHFRVLETHAAKTYRALDGHRLHLPRIRAEFLPDPAKLAATYELRRREEA